MALELQLDKDIGKLRRHIHSVELSPDENLLLVVSAWAKVVCVYDLSSGLESCRKKWSRGLESCQAVFSPDGTKVAVADYKWKGVKIFVSKTGRRFATLSRAWLKKNSAASGHADKVCGVAWSSKGIIASASYDKTVRLWNLERLGKPEGACLRVLSGHKGDVNSAAFSPDGSRLASASSDSTVRIWDVASGACLHILTGHIDNDVWRVAFSLDGNKLASCSEGGIVCVWDAASDFARIRNLVVDGGGWPTVAWSPDSLILATTDDFCIQLWDDAGVSIVKTTNKASSATFSRRSHNIIIGSDKGGLCCWKSPVSWQLNQSSLKKELNLEKRDFSQLDGAGLRKAAERGDAEAQYQLGICFIDGTKGLTKDASEAFKWFRKSAEQGNSNGQSAIGVSFENGEGVSKDLNEAAKWYRKAAEQGNSKAQCNLGVCYENGDGVEQDHKQAVEWYRKAAEQGHSDAQFQLGVCYYEGSGVEMDKKEAVKWFRKAADQGNASAQFNLGFCYENGDGVEKDLSEAFSWYRKSAEQGEASGQFKLGVCYEYGEGVEKDLSEGVNWYRKAADQGNARAQFNLGSCYKNGEGVEKDIFEAVNWYRKAAEQGNASAQLGLGICYGNGEGVEKDLSEAVNWFRKAADQGNATAQFNLAISFHNGEGINVDLNEAVKWYRKAADQGDESAQFNLGRCYENGEGVEKDLSEAVNWFRKAADQGNASAQFYLGVCYNNGEGVEKDLSQAVNWYRKAADQGNARAQFNVGNCYKNGEGVEKDLSEAVNWYRKAADQGDARAQFNLGSCYTNGVGVAQDLSEAVEWFRKSAEQGDEKTFDHLKSMTEQGEKSAFDIILELAEKGNPLAQSSVGECYQKGWGIKKDLDEASKWYFKAAEQGHADALDRLNSKAKQGDSAAFEVLAGIAKQGDVLVQCNVGECYHKGWGVTKDLEEAVKWYRIAAEQKNTDAACKLGDCYSSGDGVTKDFEEALRWYRISAVQGNAKAYCKIGECYQVGNGVTQDYKEAVKWYHMASEKEDSDAQWRLGRCYGFGLGVLVNKIEAFNLYQKSAEQGNAEGQYCLACCYYNGTGCSKDENKAIVWFRKAAEQGNAHAQFMLGFCYQNGYGVTKDLSEAAKWYRKAADQGNTYAQYNLGCLYSKGSGVAKDLKETVKWWRKAAEQGHAMAQYNLGCYNEFGQGIKIDENEAAKWYRKAADQGKDYPLGYCYEKGIGVSVNPKEAFDSYKRAYKNGDINDAPYKIGWCYENGFGVNKNLEEAVSWYYKAAEDNQAFAQCRLGYFYEQGQGVGQDFEEAFKWYSKAAEQGHAAAQFHVAECHRKELVVNSDLTEALKWYKRSAMQGHADAQFALGESYETGSGVARDLKEANKWYAKAVEKGHNEAKARLENVKMAIEAESSTQGSSTIATAFSRHPSNLNFGPQSMVRHRFHPGIPPYLNISGGPLSMGGSISSFNSGPMITMLLIKTKYMDYIGDSSINLPTVEVTLESLQSGSFINNFVLLEDPIVRADNKFGKVKNRNGKEFALKIFSKMEQYGRELFCLDLFHQEKLDIAPVAEHVGKIGNGENEKFFIISTLLCKSVTDYFGSTNPFGDRNAYTIQIIHDILMCVKKLHSKYMVHGDLKPMHFMCTHDTPPKVKMIDFDNCTAFENELTRGTESYLAPEMLRQWRQQHPMKAASSGDMWAVGLIIYHVIMGVSLMRTTYWERQGKLNQPISQDINDDNPEVIQCWIEEVLSPKELDFSLLSNVIGETNTEGRITALVRGLLRKNPGDRASAESALLSALFDVCRPAVPGARSHTTTLQFLMKSFAKVDGALQSVGNEVRQVHTVVDRVDGNVNQVDSKVTEGNKAIESVQSGVSDLKADINVIQNQNEVIRGQNEIIQGQNEVIRNQIVQLEVSLKSAFKSYVHELETKVLEDLDDMQEEIVKQFIKVKKTIFTATYQPPIPRTFFIVPYEESSKKWIRRMVSTAKGLLNNQYQLYFFCEVCSWYDVESGIIIADPKKFVRKAAPMLAFGLRMLKHAGSALPVIGNTVQGFFNLSQLVIDGISRALDFASGCDEDKIGKLGERSVNDYPFIKDILDECEESDKQQISSIAKKGPKEFIAEPDTIAKLKDLGNFFRDADVTDYGKLDIIMTGDGSFVWVCSCCKDTLSNQGSITLKK